MLLLFVHNMVSSSEPRLVLSCDVCLGETSSITSGGPIPDEDPNQKTTLGKLLLRGQMLLVDDWDQFMFICTPV